MKAWILGLLVWMFALPALATVTFAVSTGPVDVAATVNWEVAYTTGSPALVQTTTGPGAGAWKYTFEPNLYRTYRVRYKVIGDPAIYPGFSGWTPYFNTDRFQGDVNGDCTVNNVDFNQVRAGFGNSCP